jgi:hypothetical protein
MRSEGLEGVVAVFALKGLEGRGRGVRAARACMLWCKAVCRVPV